MPSEGTEGPTNEQGSRFDDVADTYDAVRPCYPDAVFDAINDYRGTTTTPACWRSGSGPARRPRRWRRTVGLSWGSNPARSLPRSRERLAGVQHVSVVTSTFEGVELEAGAFDVVASATAWHWVDPVGRLREGGALPAARRRHRAVVERARARHARRRMGTDPPNLRGGRARSGRAWRASRPIGPTTTPPTELGASGWFTGRRATRVPVLG